VLTLRVGISGHRPKPDRMPLETFEPVKRQLRQVFDAIDAALAAAKRENAAFYTAEPGHRVRLVSGLAEGADQFAIEMRPPGWQVDAILPFPEESFLRDFKHSAIDNSDVTAVFKAMLAQANTVTELPEDPRIARGAITPQTDEKRYWSLRSQGYDNLGKFLLAQSDILVVVWDGQPEDGPGGTATVVRRAIESGMAVVWIAPHGDAPAMIAALDDEQQPVSASGDFAALLHDAVSTLVSLPPDSAIGGARGGHHRSVTQRLAAFFAETWPRATRAVTYDVFRRISHRQWGRLRFRIPAEDVQEAYAKPWDAFIEAAPRAGALSARIRDTLLPRYMWADALAVERSHWYRAAYFNSYLLAAATVAIALFGVFTISEHAETMLLYKACLVSIELLLIGLIITIVRRGWRSHWQQTFVEYRALAEMLRSTRSLAYLGVYGGIQRPGALEPSSSAWFLWYLRATIRELGMPNARLDEEHLRTQLKAVRAHVIAEQLSYHHGNVANAAHLHHVLKWVRDASFIATFAILGLFLSAYLFFAVGLALNGMSLAEITGGGEHGPVPHSWSEAHGRLDALGFILYRAKTFVTFAAAFLPALGASIAGIQETGDFEGLALRSVKTESSLKVIDEQIAGILDQPTLDTVAAALLSTSEVMTEDLGAWQSIYGRKHLGLP
jgi:hypothetical protein